MHHHPPGSLLRSALRSLVAAIALLGAIQAFAQQVVVYIDVTSSDPVGKQLTYELREAIRRSASMSLGDREADARFIMRLVTLDPNDGATAGVMTVYSAVITMMTMHKTPVEMYLDNRVGTCGMRRAEQCARRLVAALDEQVVDFRRIVRDAVEDRRR
jgi:hypothetical protein